MRKLETVLILAGGLGKRLHPLTEDIPKSLVPINNIPFIAYQLSYLSQKGVKQVVLCLGHFSDQIIDFLKSSGNFNLEISYSVEEKPLGTGGAIMRASHLLGEDFGVLYGDSFLPIDFDEIYRVFKTSKKAGLMTIYKNKNELDGSNVIYKSGQVLAYSKTTQDPKMEYIDYGFSIFKKACFESLRHLESFDLSVLIDILINRRDLSGFVTTRRFYEIGSFHGILAFEDYIKNGGLNEFHISVS